MVVSRRKQTSLQVDQTRALLLADIVGRQAPLAAINMAVAAASAIALGHAAPFWSVAAWLAYMAAAQGVRLLVARRLRDARPPVAWRRGALLVTCTSALAGIGWGLTVPLFLNDAPAFNHTFVPFVLAGMAAGSIAGLTAHPPAFYAFLLTSLCPYAAVLALDGGREAGVMSLITVSYGLGMAFMGRRTHRMLRRSATLHLRNASLVDRLGKSHLDLERLVAERTAELQAANRVLTGEIEQRRRSEARVRHLSEHDALTGLATRRLLVDQLGAAIERACRDGGGLVVAVFDLDRFKEVNDTFGHLTGDKLLTRFGERVRQAFGGPETVARIGGDEFALVAPHLGGYGTLQALGRKLVGLGATPFAVGHLRLEVSVSVGMALFPDHGHEADALLSGADLALYDVKATGRGRWRVLSPELQSAEGSRRKMASELRGALERRELGLVYQPRFSLSDRRIVAVEALLRWQHPELGAVPPADFIPIAEASGIIHDVGRWVLQLACRTAAGWSRAGHGTRVAVNLSALELRQPDLVERVRRSLEAADLEPHLLELEITESAYLDRGLGALDEDLRRLAEVGVRLSIDDFGTGYSSLAYLTWLPIDTIKIDRSFVASMDRHPRDVAVVSSVISLARELRKTAVAEGIETVRQLQTLRRLGCAEGQGFLLCRPVGEEAMPALLAGGTTPRLAVGERP